MKKALIVWGGWEGHQPRECADLFGSILRKRGFDVVVSNTLDVYCDIQLLHSLKLIVPIWTMGILTEEQERGLLGAVASGVGIAGFHGGMGDSFRMNPSYQWMVGGQWVAHPDDCHEYSVTIVSTNDPITAGMTDFMVNSEQYYMHVDPSNEVLATTTFNTSSAPWTNGCVMPVVWKRKWQKGRVFYSSLGHRVSDFEIPEVLEIQVRGMCWAGS